MTYGEAANLAVNQTLMRSINTSLIALLPVAGLLFVGAGLLGVGTLKDLALVLFVGLAAGAYSSIFLATPMVGELKEREPKYKALRQAGRWPAGAAAEAGARRRPAPAGSRSPARRARRGGAAGDRGRARAAPATVAADAGRVATDGRGGEPGTGGDGRRRGRARARSRPRPVGRAGSGTTRPAARPRAADGDGRSTS